MSLFFKVCLLMTIYSVRTEITSQPLMGYEYELIDPKLIEVQPMSDGGRSLEVTFQSNYYYDVRITWKVDDRFIMNHDTQYSTFRHNQKVSIRLPPSDINKTVQCIMALNMYHVTLEIHLNGATGSVEVDQFKFDLSTPEQIIYTEADANNITFDMNVSFPNANSLKPKISSTFIAADYCSIPLLSISGNDSKFIEHNENDDVEDDDIVSQKATVVVLRDHRIRFGMIAFHCQLVHTSSRNDILSLGKIGIDRMVFFKKGTDFHNLVPSDTVTFVNWTYRYEVSESEDLDVHVQVLGNPKPRVILQRNGVDLSVSAERVDFTSPYYTFTIFPFRNVTAATSGRYVCTAVSGRGRITETFTVYVRQTGCLNDLSQTMNYVGPASSTW